MIKYVKLRDSLTKETELVTTSTILNVYNISKKKAQKYNNFKTIFFWNTACHSVLQMKKK